MRRKHTRRGWSLWGQWKGVGLPASRRSDAESFSWSISRGSPVLFSTRMEGEMVTILLKPNTPGALTTEMP